MTRRRRTAEEAQREILDVAERHLARVGPAGIRLQEIAAEVGISHPAILHHFGSREQLVERVVDRSLQSLEAELVAAFASAADSTKTASVLDRVFEVYADKGHARTVAWLLLSGGGIGGNPDMGESKILERIADAVHGLRTQILGQKDATLEDTRFTVLLAALALFADALGGDVYRKSTGFEVIDAAAAKRFRDWLARLLVRHVERPRVPQARESDR